jgi:hypothetical protein
MAIRQSGGNTPRKPLAGPQSVEHYEAMMPRAGNAGARGPGAAVQEKDAFSSERVWL